METSSKNETNISYEELYRDEKKRRETLEKEVEKKCKEIEELKKLVLSYKNSETAKNGYLEELLVCEDLKNDTVKNKFSSILGVDYEEWSRILGNSKCDIQTTDTKLSGQVKKFKNGVFQQLDRHWVDTLIESIPELNDVSSILKGLCEIPLLPNGTHVDKDKPVKKLCESNYPLETLDNFLMSLNTSRRRILQYAFLGTVVEIDRPKYLFGVEYTDKKERIRIVLFKVEDIIRYLDKLDFKITKGKSVITLGDDNVLSIQRKGGDGGKKSSNQLQFKIVISKIMKHVDHLQHEV